MGIPTKDKSDYLKGLLIIARKDNQLAETEKKIIRGIAEKLGFATDFYEDVLRTLLGNAYILDDPLIFSNAKIARTFLIDGLLLAFSDEQVSDKELNWLKKTAEVNNIEEEWFEKKLHEFKNSAVHYSNREFALYSII